MKEKFQDYNELSRLLKEVKNDANIGFNFKIFEF